MQDPTPPACGGGYTYALFNETLVSRQEMMDTLKRRNAKQERELSSMGRPLHHPAAQHLAANESHPKPPALAAE